MKRLFPLIAAFVLPVIWSSSALESLAQGFSLCSVVDAKHKSMTLAWNRPAEAVTGYSFEYNGHEMTPYRPTVEDETQLTYQANLAFGQHTFQIFGYDAETNTNEVMVEFKRPHYYAAFIPGLYQSIYRKRYASSCGGDAGMFRKAWRVAEPVMLIAATGFATKLWIDFFSTKNDALGARDAYLATLRGEELERWRQKRDEAKDLFPKALALSVATLTANAISTLFLSPRSSAEVKGGFQLDCATHGNQIQFCVRF